MWLFKPMLIRRYSEKKDDWVNDSAIRRLMMQSLPETVHANISLEAR